MKDDPLAAVMTFCTKAQRMDDTVPLFLAVDPGASGAIAVQCGPHYTVIDIPGIKVERGGKKKGGKQKQKTAFDYVTITAIFRKLKNVARGRSSFALVEEGTVGIPGKGNSAYNGFRVGCIAEGSPILTCERGWVPIEKVDRADKVWDGTEWVTHGGVVYQGEKKCINVDQIWLTPDHRLLTENGWMDAATVVALLRSGVPEGVLLAAGSETEKEQGERIASMISEGLTGLSSADSSQSSGRPSTDVTTKRQGTTPTTAGEESECGDRGGMTAAGSSGTSPNCPEVPIRNCPSIEKITTEGTFQVTCDSPTGQHKPRTPEKLELWSTKEGPWLSSISWPSSVRTSSTKPPEDGSSTGAGVCPESSELLKVYDLVNAGSRFRFQVGRMIASNCNYGMWPLFLVSQGYRYEEVRPTVWKRVMGLFGKDKETSRNKARLKFPKAPLSLVKHHDRAEALLMTEYLRLQYMKG